MKRKGITIGTEKIKKMKDYKIHAVCVKKRSNRSVKHSKNKKKRVFKRNLKASIIIK